MSTDSTIIVSDNYTYTELIVDIETGEIIAEGHGDLFDLTIDK